VTTRRPEAESHALGHQRELVCRKRAKHQRLRDASDFVLWPMISIVLKMAEMCDAQ
jgi:hypothetical protein